MSSVPSATFVPDSDNQLRLRLTRTQTQAIDFQPLTQEITSLLDVLTTELTTQSDTVQSIAEDTEQSRIHITKGNRQLQLQNERPHTLRDFLLFIIILFSILLIFLDWYTP